MGLCHVFIGDLLFADAMKNSNYVALILISLAWLLIFAGRLTPSTLLVQIMNELQITDVQAGIAFSGMWLFYGILQFPSGVLSDAMGRKKIILFSLIGFSVACVLSGLNINFVMVVLTFSLLGFASGLLPSPSFTMIAELFGPRKGQAFGIHSSIGSVSGFIPVILPFMAVMIGWRNIFFILGVFGMSLSYFIYRYVHESLQNRENQSYMTRLKNGVASITDKEVFFMFIINLVISFAWMGMLSWFPAYIQQEKGFGPEVAGLLFAVVLSGGLLLKPIIGYLSDKTNRLLILALLTLFASVSMYLLTVSFSVVMLAVVSFLFAQTAAFYPVRTSYLMDLWPSSSSGANFGVFRSLIILLGSPIPAIIGWAKETYGFDMVLHIIALGLLMTVFSMIIKAYMDLRSERMPVKN